jgi:hypothetical protein
MRRVVSLVVVVAVGLAAAAVGLLGRDGGEGVVLVRRRDGATASLRQRARAEGATALTEVRRGQALLRAARTRAGRDARSPRAGYAIPLDVIAVDPRGYAAMLPAASRAPFGRLRAGTALLSATSARLRGVGPGATLTLTGGRRLRSPGSSRTGSCAPPSSSSPRPTAGASGRSARTSWSARAPRPGSHASWTAGRGRTPPSPARSGPRPGGRTPGRSPGRRSSRPASASSPCAFPSARTGSRSTRRGCAATWPRGRSPSSAP